MRVMISTVHIKEAVVVAIPKLSVEKIIFLIDTDTKKKTDIDEIQSFFGKTLPIEIVRVHAYNLAEIALDVARKIEEEKSKGNEVVIHITEGRKTLAIGAMYGAYARASMVEGIYYLTEEKSEVISLPVLSFKLNKTKIRVLKEFDGGNKSIKELAKKLGKTEAMIYSHISDLKTDKYITNDNNLTTKGKIMII